MVYTNWHDPVNEDRLREAVKRSTSIAGVARELGIVSAGGNYRTLKVHISRLGLNTDHHKGKAWNRENYSTPSPNYHIATWKKYLIRELGHACWWCGQSEWYGYPITLELDHVDGDRQNNELENFRLLCPNCHSLTKTWRRRKSE